MLVINPISRTRFKYLWANYSFVLLLFLVRFTADGWVV